MSDDGLGELHVQEIEELKEDLAAAEYVIQIYEIRIKELEGQNTRLTSRGFEDLYDTNELLSSQLTTQSAELTRLRSALESLVGTEMLGCYEGDDSKLNYTTDGEPVDGEMVVVVNAEDFNGWLALGRATLAEGEG